MASPATECFPVIALLQVLDDLELSMAAAWVVQQCNPLEYPLVPDVRVDLSTYPDADALADFRFTCPQLIELSVIMCIPHVFFSGAGDRILGAEALAMLCYRLSYPGKLSRVWKQFGRSDSSCSRIITDIYCFLDEKWGHTLFFNDRVYASRHDEYVRAVSDKTNDIAERVSMFIDGTKAFICRPGKRKGGFRTVNGVLNNIPIGDGENLQKACYSGHKRRHCLNFQGVCTPDGLCMSFFGPVEGVRHDATMLSQSRLMPYLSQHPVLKTFGVIMYGDPAYGVGELITSPFRSVDITGDQKQFNVAMSKVRVSIEWLFGIVKRKWAFLDWNKKHKILLTPVGRMVRVAVLLTNAATCMDGGNQISSYFSCRPPPLRDYFLPPIHTRRTSNE